MATPAPTGFVAPAIPWLDLQPLPDAVDLGPGCHAGLLQQGVVALSSQPEVQALVAFGSRGRGEARADSDLDLAVICREAVVPPALKTERAFQYRQVLGPVSCGVDLVVVGAADAQHLAGSRWHVMGDVAREGRVLYVAR